MTRPDPVWIYRILHIDSLETCLKRGGLHAPNYTPEDGLLYKAIHDLEVQGERKETVINCGPGGVVHDYLPFYLGPLSPMLLRLKTGRVEGYNEGQAPIIYLVSTAETIAKNGVRFVFSDGHGIARLTQWFDEFNRWDEVDWDMVKEKYWSDNVDDMDRQRRKQAEFLVHRFCDWSLIQGIGVLNSNIKGQVESIFDQFPEMRRPVQVKSSWYY